jgi:metal-responsive CopG/Arc/MetJ family transcriptional regulator
MSGKLGNRISISLRDDQYEGLLEVAEDLGMNLSDAAREAINVYLLEHHWGRTIGEYARRLIGDGVTNEDAVELVKERFPLAKTSRDSIAWYRAQMRREDAEILTDRQARELKQLKG